MINLSGLQNVWFMNTPFLSGPNRPGARCGTKTSNNIELELTKPDGGITEYHIECNGCPDEDVQVPKDSKTYKFEGLDPYTEYTFKVTAVKTYTHQNIQKTKSSSELPVSCRTNQKGKEIFLPFFSFLQTLLPSSFLFVYLYPFSSLFPPSYYLLGKRRFMFW